MVNFEAYMLRDKNTGRWHNWGGLTEWMSDSARGGTVWFDKEKAQEFATQYNMGTESHGVIVEIVELIVVEADLFGPAIKSPLSSS